MLISKPSSTKLSVVFKDGWRVFWDGRINVHIDSISLYQGKIEGMCDITSSNERSKRSSDAQDKKAWLTSIAKNACKEESCKDVERGVNVPHPCTAHVEIKNRADRLCSRLKNDTFRSCHETLSPEKYYDSCMYDVCACNRDIESCMCDIFTDYANECSRRGKVLNHWRQSIQDCGAFLI